MPDQKCPLCDFVTEYPLMFANHVKHAHERKAITAEGPSSEIGPFQGLRHEAGHTYPAPHEPVRFDPIRAELFNKRGYENVDEIIQLRAQLETARKMFEAIIKTDGNYAIKQAQVALGQIGAGQKDICRHCQTEIYFSKIWRHIDGDPDCGLRSREVAEPIDAGQKGGK